MEILTSLKLSVPLSQVVSLLLLSTFVLLVGRVRLALFISYCFVLNWVYIANPNPFTVDAVTKVSNYNFIYFGFGILIILLAMIGLLAHRK